MIAPWAPRHPDLCRAVDAAVPFITVPVHGQHCPFGGSSRFLCVDSAHQPRVERPPRTLDGPDFELDEQVVQRFQAEPVTLLQRIHDLERVPYLLPPPPEDAIPKDRLQTRTLARRFEPAQEAFAKIEQCVQ